MAFELSVVVDTIFEELRGSTVECECDVAADLVASCFNCFSQCVECIFSAIELGSETTFVTHRGAESTVMQHFLEAMETLCSHTNRLAECCCADWADHELLECDRRIRV